MPIEEYLEVKIRKITNKQRARKRLDDRLRDELVSRHGEYCMRCGVAGSWPGLGMHHKIPKRMGGTTHRYTIDEVELLCSTCHSAEHGIK